MMFKKPSLKIVKFMAAGSEVQAIGRGQYDHLMKVIKISQKTVSR